MDRSLSAVGRSLNAGILCSWILFVVTYFFQFSFMPSDQRIGAIDFDPAHLAVCLEI